MHFDGKKVYFSTGIPADIFYSDKYLPPNVEIVVSSQENCESAFASYTYEPVDPAAVVYFTNQKYIRIFLSL